MFTFQRPSGTTSFVLGVLAAALTFVLWGGKMKTAELTVAQVDARLKAKLELYETLLHQIDTELRAAQTRHERAESKLSEREAEKGGKPILSVKPIVEQTPSYRDTREIRVDMHFTNIGVVDVEVDEVMVEVYAGVANNDVREILERTERIHDYLQVLHSAGVFDRFYPPDWESLPEFARQRAQAAWEEFDELSKKCPHGNIWLFRF